MTRPGPKGAGLPLLSAGVTVLLAHSLSRPNVSAGTEVPYRNHVWVRHGQAQWRYG